MTRNKTLATIVALLTMITPEMLLLRHYTTSMAASNYFNRRDFCKQLGKL